MSNKLKQFKNLIAMSALAAATSFGNTAKAETNMGEIEDVKETPTGTLVIKKTADAKIGDIPTPWMFGRPDGQSAFASTATTNVNEVVVDSNGTNAYVKTGKGLTESDNNSIRNMVNSHSNDYVNACVGMVDTLLPGPPYPIISKIDLVGDEHLEENIALSLSEYYRYVYASFPKGLITSEIIQDIFNRFSGSAKLKATVEKWIRAYATNKGWVGQHILQTGEKEQIKNAMKNIVNNNGDGGFGQAFHNLMYDLTKNSTKIQQLPLSKDGIPGTNGVEIGVYVSRDSRLVAAKNGSLYTITPNGDNATFTTFTPSGETYTATSLECGNFGEYKDAYFDGKHIYALGSKGGFIVNTERNSVSQISFSENRTGQPAKIVGKDGVAYIAFNGGENGGEVMSSNPKDGFFPDLEETTQIARLGEITGMSFKKLPPGWSDTNSFSLAVCDNNNGYVELRINSDTQGCNLTQIIMVYLNHQKEQ